MAFLTIWASHSEDPGLLARANGPSWHHYLERLLLGMAEQLIAGFPWGHLCSQASYNLFWFSIKAILWTAVSSPFTWLLMDICLQCLMNHQLKVPAGVGIALGLPVPPSARGEVNQPAGTIAAPRLPQADAGAAPPWSLGSELLRTSLENLSQSLSFPLWQLRPVELTAPCALTPHPAWHEPSQASTLCRGCMGRDYIQPFNPFSP